MAAGLGVLRLDPKSFWSMTPKELSAAFGALGGTRFSPPSRGEVAAMMARFPD